MLALANKVLTISKLEHGQLLLDKNWIQLRPMVDELVHTFTVKAEKPITFRLICRKRELMLMRSI